MAGIEKLTASKVARISKPGRYGDGGRLYLQISKSGVKSWVLRYEIAGSEHYMGLGPLHEVDIRQARERAREARACLASGRDPLRERRAMIREASEARKTFDECATAYIAIHKSGWKSDKHRKQWESSLQSYVSPHFGDRDVREITTAHVLSVLEPIWTTKVVTASRLRERIERVLSWAAMRGFREAANPARWDGHMQELLPKPSRIRAVRHHLAMAYQEIGAFFNLLEMAPGIGARALAFTILTACRTGETLAAKWDEIDLAQRVWIIPAARMKSGRPHHVPLSDAALGILKSVRGRHPTWVFPNSKGGRLYGSVMLDVLKKMNCHGMTVHGFRSSFRVWVAERTAYPREMAELALAHRAGSSVEEAYQRSDLFERRQALMQDWAIWCATTGRDPRR